MKIELVETGLTLYGLKLKQTNGSCYHFQDRNGCRNRAHSPSHLHPLPLLCHTHTVFSAPISPSRLGPNSSSFLVQSPSQLGPIFHLTRLAPLLHFNPHEHSNSRIHDTIRVMLRHLETREFLISVCNLNCQSACIDSEHNELIILGICQIFFSR